MFIIQCKLNVQNGESSMHRLYLKKCDLHQFYCFSETKKKYVLNIFLFLIHDKILLTEYQPFLIQDNFALLSGY